MTQPIHAIVLAAGQGTRMRSARPKVLHTVAGQPMLGHVLRAARTAGVTDCHVVLGHGAAAVQDWLGRLPQPPRVVIQPQQLGTGDAVRCALPGVPDRARVVVLYGDVPLVSPETIRALIDAAGSDLAIVTVDLQEPAGYGRILREPGDDDAGAGRILGIVEERDASEAQRAIREVNTGLLAAPARRLKRWLSHVTNDNARGEYYLTDVVARAARDGVDVASVQPAAAFEVEGVNDAAQLARVERHLQRRQAAALQREGLYLADPERFDLRGRLTVGRDVRIDVGVVVEGEVTLGDEVSIGPYCVLRNVRLGAGSEVRAYSLLDTAEAGERCIIGPYARLRPGTALGDEVMIGNFVEIKQSVLGDGSKANHLAYVGDAIVGARTNIGAGVITCNYDGVNKHATIIGDDVFIGSDSQLLAPVTIGDRAYIAAGSTIASDAPEDALTINRARAQKSLPGWQRPKKR